jgi:hypothetical protein
MNSNVGGLIGYANLITDGAVVESYSNASVTAGTDSSVGGLVGYIAQDASYFGNTYWNTVTSGISNLSEGAGNMVNDLGIAGLTTAQFQSGLPAGFSTQYWTEQASVNDGLPYLQFLPANCGCVYYSSKAR